MEEYWAYYNSPTAGINTESRCLRQGEAGYYRETLWRITWWTAWEIRSEHLYDVQHGDVHTHLLMWDYHFNATSVWSMFMLLSSCLLGEIHIIIKNQFIQKVCFKEVIVHECSHILPCIFWIVYFEVLGMDEIKILDNTNKIIIM